MIRALCSGLGLLSLFLACSVHAQVARFAVIIGNNRGDSGEGELRYAESDAVKVYSVMREIGGFEPHNMSLLAGEDAATVRSTLIAFNDRIRSSGERGQDSVLFVYYSGHADEEALHLGQSRLRINELAQLVRGSSATVRLLVADACRSGALTRVKGGKPVPAFDLPSELRLPGEGLAFLTASAASEDAQESDEIRGSFFTHALVSGLLGAADRNGDGLVVLEEAYRYAYDTTIRATSRTFRGVQHPTFHYELRGRDGVVLTRLSSWARRGVLILPAKVDFLIFHDDANGAVLAELPAQVNARTLSLSPGRYFLRGRAADFLLEGPAVLADGERQVVDASKLARVAYARLARKGGATRLRTHSLELGPSIHSQTQGEDSPCVGATGGYMVDAQRLSFSLRLGGCRSRLQNEFLSATNRKYQSSFAVLYPWDLPYLTVSAGLGAGLSVVTQHFETRGLAPNRTIAEPFIQLLLVLTTELTPRFFLRLDGRGETHFVKLQTRGAGETRLDVPFVVQGALLLGAYIR